MDPTGTPLARARAWLFSSPPGLVRVLRRATPQRWKDRAVETMMLSDRKSRASFRRAHARGPAPAVPIRLRALGGAPIWIRPGTDDPWVVRELLTYGDHWPAVAVGRVDVILDLGANIGVAMALFAHRFRQARVVGVEPDPSNAELCRRNVARWRDRCEVVEAAAWISDEPVRLSGDSSAALRLSADGSGRTVPGISIATLVKEHARASVVDYVKIDVEGAERELLARADEWKALVRSVSVEVHAPYTIDACRDDLRRHGFEVCERAASRGPRVVGIRR